MAASKFPDEKELHDFVTSGHAQDILLSINSLRKNKKLCDVVLIVENKEFPAHRIVLAACSDYFCAMFTSDMAESQESKVTLNGLSADIMEVLLDFVYTESVKVSVENVQALLPAACLLQLTGVKNACCEFLELQLHPSNCLGIKKFAETHGCHALEKAANNYVHKHFIDVVDSEEFVLLSNSDVEQLIQNDYLTLPSEAAVFEALMQWIAHEEENRKDHLPQLLQHIRLPLLTPKYLTDTVDNEPLIRRNLDCRDLVDEAKKFHLRPECRHEMQSERTKPRLGLSEVLYVLGGFGSYQSPIDLVEKFDPQKNEWNVVAPMSRKRRYLCSVALGKKVYAIGGYDASSRLNAVECLDVNNNCWTQIATMIHRRGLAGATTLGGKIYVAGGYDGALRHASVECYDPTIDQWSLVSEMSMTREGAGLTNMDGVLYCVGGYDGTSILNGVERFDPRTGQWAQVAPMTTRRSGAGIAVVDSQLYALGGYDGTQHLSTVECFSPCTNQWRSLADMNSKRCYVGSTTVGSKVYAVGGYDGTALLDTVESFDVRREEWTLLSSMTTKRCDMGVAVVSEH